MGESEFVDKVAGALAARDIYAAVAEICGLVMALRRRVAELEARPTLKYRATWVDGLIYEKGQLVTLGGSVWHCNARTTTRPTTHDGSWHLAVKAGRDGKSAR